MRVRLIKGELGDGTEAGRCTRVVGAALRLRAGRWWGRSQSADVSRESRDGERDAIQTETKLLMPVR